MHTSRFRPRVFIMIFLPVMVDLCVETEIRELSPKVFVSLPKEYWDNKKTTEAIFQAIAAANDPVVKTEQVIGSRSIKLINWFNVIQVLPIEQTSMLITCPNCAVNTVVLGE
jgi:hypothetical protein